MIPFIFIFLYFLLLRSSKFLNGKYLLGSFPVMAITSLVLRENNIFLNNIDNMTFYTFFTANITLFVYNLMDIVKGFEVNKQNIIKSLCLLPMAISQDLISIVIFIQLIILSEEEFIVLVRRKKIISTFIIFWGVSILNIQSFGNYFFFMALISNFVLIHKYEGQDFHHIILGYATSLCLLNSYDFLIPYLIILYIVVIAPLTSQFIFNSVSDKTDILLKLKRLSIKFMRGYPEVTDCPEDKEVKVHNKNKFLLSMRYYDIDEALLKTFLILSILFFTLLYTGIVNDL